MFTFIGEYQAKLDDRGRLVLPSAFKNLIPDGQTAKFVVKKNSFDDCLEMIPYCEWEKEAQEVRNGLNIIFNAQHARFWREYMRGRDIVEPDPKFGRIAISRKLLEEIGVVKDVVFSGSGYKIEIWSKEKYALSGLSDEEFLAIAEDIASSTSNKEGR